tara:strand:- start:463 stop:672 length:210 start_codon:yes stop_codon:yes gene_type:complete
MMYGKAMEINAISPVARTYQYVESVQKVIPQVTADGKDKVEQTNYVVTVYDNAGRISTSHSNHVINYLV